MNNKETSKMEMNKSRMDKDINVDNYTEESNDNESDKK